MRIMIAPDGFKGSLSAFQAGEAVRRGATRACPNAEIDVCPLSDGGEGLASVLAATVGGVAREARITGPMGDQIEASWMMLADGRTALIESAAAIGLGRVPEDQRAPMQTTTYGVGELIREALVASARTIMVGLGGSATTDGGVGMAQALGIAFEGVAAPAMGGQLTNVRGIDVARRDALLARTELIVLSDVNNPLTGADGAARTYGPQKGASDVEVAQLDAALAHLATLAGDEGTHAGDGAAGGLGYGLRVFAGAHLQSGVDFVLDATRFDERLKGCHLVLTGEGRLDAQSSRGKVVAGVSRRCKAQRVPVVALVGAVGPGAAAVHDEGLTAYFSLCDRPMPESDAKEQAAALLETLAYNVVRLRVE